MNEDNFLKMTDFDRLVSSEPIQIMKAMIPYAPPQGQRFLSLYSKAMELRNTLNAFQRGNPEMSICSSPRQSNQEPMEMLNSIRDYCSPATRQKMDECMNMFAMLQMLELFQDNGE